MNGAIATCAQHRSERAVMHSLVTDGQVGAFACGTPKK